MSAPRATCELWIDGERVGDDPAAYLAGVDTVLAPLKISWGRDNVLDQPEAATCTFALQRAAFLGPESLRQIGARVEVYADTPPTGDIDPAEAIEDGRWLRDPQPAFRVTTANRFLDGRPNVDILQFEWADIGADHGLVLQQVYMQAAGYGAAPKQSWRVWIPPRAWTALPEEWDGVPALRPGGPWTVSAEISGPNRADDALHRLSMVGMEETIWPEATNWYPDPVGGQAAAGVAATVGGGHWVPLAGRAERINPNEGQIWPGLQFYEADRSVAVWVDRWELGEGSWADYRPGTSWADDMCIRLDNVSVLAPEEAPARVLVFSGRITDAEMSYAGDDVTVANYTAADLSAELENVVVGDEPWAAERADARMKRIVALTPDSVRPGWRPFVNYWAPQTVGYRDVDSQPALGLLQDVAQSAGLVLWVATHVVTGPYLYPENPGEREPLNRFVMGVAGEPTVVTNGVVGVVSACDILRDPMKWAESVANRTTRVDVTWQEQTVDEEGKPSPTDRTVSLVDADAEVLYGMRRLSVSTELATSGDAFTLAQRLRQLTADTGWRASGFTMPVAALADQVPGVDALTRQRAVTRLLGGVSRLGLPLNIMFDPAPVPGYPALAAYTEGGEYEYDNGWVLSLNLSPATYQGERAFMAWEDTPAMWTWESFSAIMWANAWAAPISTD